MMFRSLIAIFLFSALHGNSDAHAEIRITGVRLSDRGGQASSASDIQVDVQRDTCSDDVDEPFHDALLSFSVTNDSSTTIQITHLRFAVPRAKAAGRRFSSPRFSVSSVGEVASNGGTAQVLAFFANQRGTGKRFIGSRSSISTTLGFRNVRFVLSGVTGRGSRFTLPVTLGIVFGNYDRCAS